MMNEIVELETEVEGEVVRQVVSTYLQTVISAIDTVLCETSPFSISPEVLLDHIARKLLKAFSPSVLTASLPPSLSGENACNEDEDSDGDDEDNLIKDTPIPRKHRRLDYLRCILRRMAPVAIDVAATICASQADFQTLVLLFGTWLPLAPHITPLVSDAFVKSSCNPFENIVDEYHQWHLLEALHSISRHFSYEQGHLAMARWWSWAPIITYLKPTTDMETSDNNWSVLQATRWHAARTLGYLFDMSPGTMGSFLKRLDVQTELVPWVLHPWILHQEEVDWEIQHKNGVVSFFDSTEVLLPTALQVRSYVPLNSSLVHLGEGLVFPKELSSAACRSESSIVLTATTQQNLALVGAALAFEEIRPILLSGPTASGKSTLVRHLCTSLGKNLLELHVDDDTDSKTLIGSYQTTDIPGEFSWQPGALTRAVRSGTWVLLEDLDTVPLEIQAALVPLLEDRRLPLGPSGENEVCHPGFRLFATLSTSSRRHSSVLSSRLWRKVRVQPLLMSEWKEIASAKYPKMPVPITNAALNILERCSDQKTAGRPAAVRDFLKLLSRISTSVTFGESNDYATEAQRTLCLAETLDVFAAHSPDMDQTRAFASQVAAPAWGVTADLAFHYLFSRRPELIRSQHATQIGRAILAHTRADDSLMDDIASSTFAPTNSAMRLMESVLVCVRENEPTLLVGETGCGKTTILQQLAQISNHSLIVQNLSLQTDSTDLLGGYRPLEITHIARKIYLEFVDLFVSSFSRKQNAEFLNFASSAFQKNQWAKLSQCLRRAGKLGLEKMKSTGGTGKGLSSERWQTFAESAERFERQRQACETKLAFSFTEGALVDAIRTGKWVLLDEINLASSETLQRLCGLLDDSTGSVTLTERGDAVAIARHPDFRLFAAMNPATDAGKKDLPVSIRSRFTEIYVDELSDPNELRTVAGRYLAGVLSSGNGAIEHCETVVNIVDTFLMTRHLASKSLVDAGGQRPRYTLRTLCRALTASKNLVQHQRLSLKRGILEGFELAFEGPLESDSLKTLKALLQDRLWHDVSKEEVDRPGRRPGGRGSESDFVLIKPFWINRGPFDLQDWSNSEHSGRAKFILTKTMLINLRRLSRAVAAGPWPVLLEGPTSAGKTTLVEYLAARCGHKVVRINNHEHTDVQEYTGSYASDENGSLSFRDGILVQALRKGHWVILDELNLAPSEVLEALNRLLDDNRELYLAEVNETVTPHPNFRLFATQNPSGAYGGRKPLSRAFRNRFVEIHMGDIPAEDMITILEKRSGCPSTHAKLLVSIMTSLRQRRSKNGVFLGKDGLITPRDLLRWAERRASTKIELAEEGFMLLGERLRSEVEREAVREEIERHLKVSVSCEDAYYGENASARRVFRRTCTTGSMSCDINGVAPTRTILRLLSLVLRCIKHHEPVLLVGDTGCGKTTVVQLLSTILQRELKIVNCHATTETSDLIGGLRPVRGRMIILTEMCKVFRELAMCLSEVSEAIKEDVDAILETTNSAVDNLPDDFATRIMSTSRALLQQHENDEVENLTKKRKLDCGNARRAGNANGDTIFDKLLAGRLVSDLERLHRRFTSLFEWVDGSLVQAMKKGHLFLLDEMSLAEDAVLERLNSVLEPSRTIVLAEKGDDGLGEESHVVKGHADFLIFATMNPGGDFGKRELSPALRSRFTEIWVSNVVQMEDVEMVLDSTFKTSPCFVDVEVVKKVILTYVIWFNSEVCGDASSPCSALSLSLRDVITWARFVTEVLSENAEMTVWEGLIHGSSLMHLDGLGLGTGLSRDDAEATRMKATSFLLDLLPPEHRTKCHDSVQVAHLRPVSILNRFGIHPFSIPCGPNPMPNQSFNFQAPTTGSNLLRVLRAMQLSKPILLEGSPGVGKTSLVSALAKAAGYNLVRINLSEQTDISDLMGSDLPMPEGENYENMKGSTFKWCDGILLRAIKRGDWVLLDELNLATQSVLEGLNSCLDHRASVYIPELGETFQCPPSLRIFAAQNPLYQGGGRKGLPKSFLNRFTKVYVEALNDDDLQMIVGSSFSSIPLNIRRSMVRFNSAIHTSVGTKREYGDAGSPWEFNLRDIFRWCELADSSGSQDVASFGSCARDLYLQRFRTSADRRRLSTQFKCVFDSESIALEPARCIHSDESVTIGSTTVDRNINNADAKPQIGANYTILRSLLLPMEAVARCIVMNWPCLIVGQSGTGKTSLLKSLACNLNVKLVDVCLTPATDVNELVGSFEQVDCLRDEKELIWTLGVALRRLICTVGNSCDELELALKAYEAYEVMSKLLLNDNVRPGVFLLGPATAFLQIMKSSRVRNDPCVMRIETLMRRLREGQNVIERGGRFCWIDGILVDAMVNGYWLHLENVNLCSSSVLDRLNPVMESGGELLLSETGTQDNGASHRSIKPHRNFRLFLSMNPDRGEVSRAMRNRCVEVSLLAGSETSFVDEHDLLCTNLRTVDQMDVLSRNGIMTMDLVTSLLRIFQTSAKLCCEANAGAPSLESPRQMASGVRGMRRRGLGLRSCLGSAMEITYEAMAYGSAELISVASTRRESDGLECHHAPVVPGIRENWSIHPDLAAAMFDARLIQCQHLTLPKWLRRFRSAEVSPRETALNEVCKGVEESADEWEFLLMQSLLMYLLTACSQRRNAFLRSSFLDNFSNKYSRILAFLSTKLSRFKGHMLSVLVDRWALVVLELQERKRAEMIGNIRIDSPGLNVFDVSYWLHAGKIERSLVQCPITPAIYLLFGAIDEWSGVLEDRALGLGQTSGGAASISELRKLYGARDQLRIFFKKTEYVSSEASTFLAFDETRFIVQWTWFKKAVSSINRSFLTEDQNLMPSSRKLDSLIHSIDMVLLDGDGLIDLAGDLLWKKGGHPLVSATSLHWQAILDIRKTSLSCSIKALERFNCLAQIETSQITIEDLIELQHPVLFIEQATKQDLLEALCMAYYSSTEELACRSPADNAWVGDYHVVCQGVQQAKASFVAAWKAAQVDTTIATVENLFDVEILEQLRSHLDENQSQTLDPQQIMLRFAEVQIAPIVEFWLIHSELQLISEFSSILMSGLCDTACRQTITISARRFVQVALACPVWEVADLRPFQTIVWAFDSPASEVALCQLLKCLLPIMLYASSRHLWRNTLNDLGAVSSILEYPLQWSASKHVNRMPLNRWQTCVGPSRVWEHARTDAILKLIGPEFSASLFGPKKAHYLTLENHQARENQSKALLRQLSTFAADVREQRFPSEAVYLFSNVIEALEDYFPDNGSARIVSSLRKGKNLLEEDLVDIQYHLNCCTHLRFKECHPAIVSPLLLSLLAAAQTKERHNASLAWIFIGLLRVHLLVPQSPLDPGQKPIAKVEQLHTRLAYIRRKIATFRLDSGLESGDFSPANATLDEWEAEARVTMRKIGSQEKKMVDRGQQCPSFIDLFRAIRGFWKSTANPAVVRSIADVLVASQKESELLTTLQREQNWQVTAASFCDQMTTHFDSYDDVVLPFVVAVQCIQRGLRELRDRFSGVISPGSTLASLSLTNLLRFPFHVADHHLHQQRTAMSVLTRSSECESDGAKKCGLALAISALARYRLQKRAIGFLESTTATHCTCLFDSIIKSWIKFVDGLYVKDSTDEAAQERLYREQFPDHVKDFVAFLQSQEDDDSDGDADEEFPSDMIAEVKLSDELIAVLYELYQELFSDNPQLNTNSARILSFHVSYGGAHLFRSLIPNIGIGLNLHEDMGSHCLAVALSCSGRTSLKTNLTSSKGYSFHNDPNPVEIRKASAPLQSLLTRTSKLLTAFPGHEILISLGQVAEFVRKLELTSTSVGKAMTGLEVVLRKAQEWEEHASERVKLGSCLVEISQLVTSWRKLELTNWASLLDSREERFAKRARRHWMRLFSVLNIAHEESLMDDEQTIVQSESLSTTPSWIWKGFRRRDDANLSPATAERMECLTKLLDTFVLTSCVGEFEERIGLLKSLACQFGVKVDLAGQSIFRLLSSICSYYSQFLPLVASRQNAMRSPLESKLKDEVKLAKWDVQSYYALVESTERNHRKLMKHLRGYDDVLEVSLSSLLEEYYSEGIRAPDSAGIESSTKVPSNKEIFPLIENSAEVHGAESITYSATAVQRKWESAISVGLASDEFVRRMSQFHKKMTTLLSVETIDRQCWAQVGSQLSADVCIAVFDRIQSLRKDKTSRQMKQRAVSDLFKALKKNGFKSTKWSVPGELRDMKHIFLLPVPSACGSLLSEGAMTQLANAKVYFERSLLEVQRLRAEVSILGSTHMTLREMELMTNFSYHGLLLIAQQRSIVAECLINVPRLRTAVATLTSLSGSLPTGQERLLGGIRDFDFEFNCARETLGQLELVISATLGLREGGDVGPAMRDAISILSNCQALMDERQSSNANLVVTWTILRERQAMCLCLQTVKEKVQACHDVCCKTQLCLPSDPFETCFAAIKKAIDIGCDLTTRSELKSLNEPGGDAVVVEHFLTLASKAVQSTLLIIQNVHKNRDSDLSEEPTADPEDDVALWETHRRMCLEWETLQVPGLTSVLAMLTNDLVSIHECERIPEHQRKWLVSVASDVATLVEQVFKLSLSRLNASISFFRNASKLQYVLARIFRTLVAKGYCADKKSEDSEGDGAGDLSGMKFEDDVEGTGMGEGDGKEDVTDQLESEEQILGLKDDNAKDENESTNDPKKLEEDEAKKGMEMEADFDGDMFDVPDESQEAEGDDDEEEELDREMGDGVNDKDDVVDEKMWGESDDDEDINREEEKFEKDSKAQGEAIEEEMRTKDDDEGDVNPDGGKSEPQAQTQDEKPPADGADDQDHNINEDLEDNYEEKHEGVDVREQEEATGDDCNDMDLDDGLDLNEDKGDEVVDDDEGEGNDDQAAEPTPDDEGDDAGNPHAEGQPEIDDEMVNDEEDEDVLETGAIHEGAVVEQSDDTPDDEEQEEPEGPRVDKPSDSNSRQDAFGVKAKDGTDNMKEHVNDEDDNADEEGGQGEDQNTGTSDHERPQDLSSGSGGNQGSGGQREEGHGIKEMPAPTPTAPNPFKSPGDATKFWHKKLKIVESGLGAPEEEDATGNDTNEDVVETGNDGEFEYADENQANASQVLGEAMEESTSAFEDQRRVDEGDLGEESVDEVKPGPEQNDPQSEQTSSRKASKPTTLSNAMEGDPEGEDDDVIGDDKEEQDEPTKETIECDSMDVDGDQSEERSNQVVSDLTQLHIDDDANMLDQAKIIEEDGTTGISYEEAAASRVRWNAVAGETHNVARRLCEKLRLVMEPLLATKLKGDYRTGKRINMKKVIGYVASGYRKDKIWLRRTKPAKRNYRVLLAVDNSESMHRSGAGDMALAAMATLAVGMSQLEIGELGIASFGDEMRLLHPFHLPFTSEAGPGIIHSFPFDEKRTRTALCVASALTAMDLHGDHAAMQLMFMISDGRIERDSRSSLRRLMREMVERNILLVMIVVEGDKNEKERRRDSIVHMMEVTFENGKPKVKQFMEDYPFPYYIILEDMQSLPEVLGDALRQWFEMIAQLQQR